MVLHRTGVNQPDSLRKGTFSDLTKPNNPISPTSKTETQKFTDFFNMEWPGGNFISEASNNTVKATVKNITRLYRDKFKLVTLNSTTEITFIAGSKDFQQVYSNQIITELYSPISSSLERSSLPNNIFSFERLRNLEFNNEKFYPNLAVISGSYRYSELGFDIPKVCYKYKSWANYASQDQKLLNYYKKNYKEMIDIFTSYFKQKYFLDAFGNIYLNLTTANFQNNLTLSYILINCLISDLEMFSEEKLAHVVSKNQIKIVYDSYKFLQYEYLQYNNLYSMLQIAPFINFMFEEFNLRMKYINGWTISNIKQGNLDRKMILFSLYSETFTSFFKLLNLDQYILINERHQLISEFNSWDEDLRNATKLKVMPVPIYGSSIQIELISQTNQDNANIKDFYIGLRTNYQDEYIFVLSIVDFNNLIGLSLIEPHFTGDEMEFYCGTVIS